MGKEDAMNIRCRAKCNIRIFYILQKITGDHILQVCIWGNQTHLKSNLSIQWLLLVKYFTVTINYVHYPLTINVSSISFEP